jgi:tetratricopeptide (TPR) repeat protein
MSEKNMFVARPLEGRSIYERHVEQLRNALAENPDTAYERHGFVFFHSMTPEERMAEYERLKLLRGDHQDLYNQATLAAIAGDLKTAKAKLEKALEMQPDFFDAAYQLAAVHERLGDLTKARQLAQRALDLAPEDEVPDVEDEIRNLGKSPADIEGEAPVGAEA